jgi:hypothetical protein
MGENETAPDEDTWPEEWPHGVRAALDELAPLFRRDARGLVLGHVDVLASRCISGTSTSSVSGAPDSTVFSSNK